MNDIAVIFAYLRGSPGVIPTEDHSTSPGNIFQTMSPQSPIS